MKVAYLGGRNGVRRRVRTKFGLFGSGSLADGWRCGVRWCGLWGVWYGV